MANFFYLRHCVRNDLQLDVRAIRIKCAAVQNYSDDGSAPVADCSDSDRPPRMDVTYFRFRHVENLEPDSAQSGVNRRRNA